MVRTQNRGGNICPYHPRRQPVADEKIIDPPSRVVPPGVEAIGPPAVCPGLIRVEQAEGIGKAGGEQASERLPLLVGKPGIPRLGPGFFRSIS